tara:strand:- start:509 stop:1555 length:1047 start_codon:yes stop_codon:yes gene_type:complete
MATSLYDQYHSEKNTTHIYDLIDTLVKRKTGQSIKNEPNNFNVYNNQLKNIFIKSENDTLEKLNRELILYHVQYFVNEIQSQQTPPPSIPPRRSLNTPMRSTELPSLLEKNELPEMSFEDLIKQRNNDTPNAVKSKQTDISSLSNDTPEMNFEDLIDKKTSSIVKPIISDVSEDETSITISSMNRLDERSNRFNYVVELKESVKQLNRVILPIESNIYFSLPILKLTIPEFKYETDIICERTYIFNHRKMGIYIPLDRDVDYVETETVNIVLSNRFNRSIIEPDIVEVDVVDNKISLDQKNLYQIGDIVNIEDSFITVGATFDIEYETESKVVRVKNTNLQNLLIFTK